MSISPVGLSPHGVSLALREARALSDPEQRGLYDKLHLEAGGKRGGLDEIDQNQPTRGRLDHLVSTPGSA